jgi:shikimate kinase
MTAAKTANGVQYWYFMKNIYLIGMMGSGKTTTGQALAKLFALKFVDVDDLIVERAHQSINDIFKKQGEPYFRKLESEILHEVSMRSSQVASTGGGIVLMPENVEQMKKTGTVIYLKTSLEVLWERVKDKTDRPLLKTRKPQKTLADLLRDRSFLYEAAQNKTFLTDQKTPEEVATEIYKTCFSK